MKYILLIVLLWSTNVLAGHCDKQHNSLLKKWKIKSTPLIKSVSKYSCSKPVFSGNMMGYTNPVLKAFSTKKELLRTISILKKNSCNTLDGNFGLSDVYDNEGNCYIFDAKLLQRLDRNTGLAIRKKEYTSEQDNLFYVTFKKSWSEGSSKTGIIKGEGNFQYRTTSGASNNVPKGKVLQFK